MENFLDNLAKALGPPSQADISSGPQHEDPLQRPTTNPVDSFVASLLNTTREFGFPTAMPSNPSPTPQDAAMGGATLGGAMNSSAGNSQPVNEDPSQSVVGGISSQLQKAFGDGMAITPPLPTRKPNEVSGMGAAIPPLPSRKPENAEPAMQGAEAGMNFGGVADTLRHILAGAAAGNPSAPPIKAFAQGGHGAMQSMEADKRRKETAAEKKDALERNEAAAAQSRADKQFDREFNQKLKLSREKREQAAEGRAGRLAKLNEFKTISQVMKSIDPTLDTKDKIAIERLVRDEAKRLTETGEEAETVINKISEYRSGLEDRIKGNKPRVAPQAAQQAPQASGDGSSSQSPAQPANKEQFDVLPSGAWFINPSDGNLMQKK